MVSSPGSDDRASSSLHPVGATIAGKYRILRLIGQGGMGAVYKAQNLAIGRTVAIKLLHRHLADDGTVLARFQREARAAASVGHRHVVEVLDMGVESSGEPFLVMEYVRGKSLDRVMSAEGPFSPERALRVTAQLLRGLATVHARGIIHRDLKPENIMLTVEGGEADFVKIFDFGVATFTEGARSTGPVDLTPYGRTMGTPHYSSPEQLRGVAGRDGRVDLYSVGVILFEMLAGSRPFVAEGFAELCERVLYDDPPPLSVFVQGLPEGLEALLRRALDKDPERRFRSAAEFASALVPFGAAPFVDDEPEPTDTFIADLRELRERERAGASVEAVGAHETQVSGRLLVPARVYLREQLGEAQLGELLAEMPREVSAGFLGSLSHPGWYSSALLGVLERADARFGRGDRGMIAEAGRRAARAMIGGGALEELSTAELVFDASVELYKALFSSGDPRIARVSRGHGRLELTGEPRPTLARSVAFVGFLDELLRGSGARTVEVRLAASLALGDAQDRFEASWVQ